MKLIVTKHASERLSERLGKTVPSGAEISIKGAVEAGKGSNPRDTLYIYNGIVLVVDLQKGKLVTVMTEGRKVEEYKRRVQ